jgi:hypothetical protein
MPMSTARSPSTSAASQAARHLDRRGPELPHAATSPSHRSSTVLGRSPGLEAPSGPAPGPSSVKAGTISATRGQCCDDDWNPPLPLTPARWYPRTDPTGHPAGRRPRLLVQSVRRRLEERARVAHHQVRRHPCCFPSPGVWNSEQQSTSVPALSTGIIGCIPGATVRSRLASGGRSGGRKQDRTSRNRSRTQTVRSARPDLPLAPGVDSGPAGPPFRVRLMPM